MSDSPQTDAFILPATEKNYERLLESHGRLERDHAVLLAVSKALRAYLLDLDRFKGRYWLCRTRRKTAHEL